MTCPRCQHENPSDQKFCGECGARLVAPCPACGAPSPPSQKFCGECGASLGPLPAAQKSPETYTPKHLAEKILTSKSALEGERKQVTVLFADLKGSMELLADRDPEEARKLLDPVLEHMMEAVHRYEGTVNQVMGDGIMALFGAPLAHEDHAVRACYAALRIQESVGRYAEGVRRVEGIPIQIRVGLNSGEVVVRAIGSDLHMDYTAVGQTTHLAARMEQMALPGSILMTAHTFSLAEGFIQVKPLGPLPVKGLGGPLEVYEVTGVEPVRSRLHATAARGLTRFVGRAAELEALSQALERTRAGHGQILALVGEPGVGKSRLFWEFIHSHETHGILVLESFSASYGAGTPYLPIIDLLKEYCQIEARDDGRRIRERLTGKLLALDRALEPILPALLALLDVPVVDPTWDGLDPSQRRPRTRDALKRLFLRECQVQPVCLVLQDLHWIDSETQSLLDDLIESLHTARLLLLVNYRPEYQHGWTSKSHYTQVRINPLAPEGAEELLRAILGDDDPELGPLKRLLITQTQGNPFFLEESVRTLVESRLLNGQRGAYRLAKGLPTIHVPATVQAVLAARIDRLPPEEKRLLQAAAVIGEQFQLALIEAIADEPKDVLYRRLSHLRVGEFLHEARLFPDLEYTFRHGLTRQVAYESLLQKRRHTLHARIVGAIELLYPDRLTEHAEQLAHHAAQGELWEKAATYLRQAGVKAFARSANREAVACFEQALVALQHLPEVPETLARAIDVRLDLRNALFPLGQLERIVEYLRQAETIATSLDDPHRLARVSCYIANSLRVMGDHRQAIDAGRRALALATTLGDSPLQLETNSYLGQAYYLLGDYTQATEALAQSVAALEEGLVTETFELPAPPSVFCRTWLAWCLTERGEFTEALSHVREAVRIAEAAKYPNSLAVACYGLGGVHLRQGDLSQAVPVLERGLAICRASELPVSSAMTALHLGFAYVLADRVVEALPLLEQAVAETAAMRMRTWHAIGLTWLAEANRLAGRPNDALDHVERALAIFREHGERGHLAWGLRLFGDLQAHLGAPDPQRAEDAYREAITLAGELGMQPLLARSHLSLGSLFLDTRRPTEARAEFSLASMLFRSMHMTFWLARAEAALAQARPEAATDAGC